GAVSGLLTNLGL
uniref:Dynastin-7 n=1 Tax=Limnodynastes salmini TaxID=39404 RepID=DYS7_LIMSA|nr:RecName: Full=Dynastin-7 [Limnodynastes salmini]prf//1923189D dynastin 7 [Limnodynastes salmini]